MADLDEAEELPRTRCLELLGSHSVGRIALSQRALPTVVPVTYRLVRDRLVFVSPPASGIFAGAQHPVVAFQVDEIDPANFAGWSVVVVGALQDLAADDPGGDPPGFARGPFPPGAGNLLAGLTTDHISGRRFSPFAFGSTA